MKVDTLNLGYLVLIGKGEHGSVNTEREVFTAIISICSSRILSRLRLTGRRKHKRSFKDVLSHTVDCINCLTHNNADDPNTIAVLASFATAAKEIIKLEKSWCNHQTSARLENLVEGIFRLHRQQIVRTTLSVVSDRDMEPSLKASLINMVSKVARYRQAARLLYRTAKKFPIVRRARVEITNLPPEAFHLWDVREHQPQLLATILRTAPNFADVNKLGHIWRLLQITPSDAQNGFSQHTCHALQRTKIHAEVQLIFYCELQSALKFPRVICSSKDACFLCNALISVHGKMHTPRCHGRLYPGWRLPFLPESSYMQRQLNGHLESTIRDSLRALIANQKRTVHPSPLESTLLTLPTSVSTRMSSHSHRSAFAAVHSEMRASVGRTSIPVINGLGEDSDHERQGDHRTSERSLDDTEHFMQPIRPGVTATKPTTCISPLYAAGSLEVQIEYDRPSASAEDLVYSVEWLSAVDVERNDGRCHSHCVIDVESLRHETSHALCDQNTLYIAAGDLFFRLRFHSNA